MVTIVRKGYGILDTDVEVSNISHMLSLWNVEFSYEVVETSKDIFLITFTLCDQKKSVS